MTEEQILAMLLARDSAVLEELRRQYERYCAAIAAGILADRADVEEVVADVWMQVWTSIPPNEPEHLRLYVGRIARNLALNRLEYLGAGKRAALPLEELEAAAPDRSLDRQMFLLRYWYGDSIEEIAHRSGCSQTKVTGVLFRLRRKLRDHLEKEDIYVGTN